MKKRMLILAAVATTTLGLATVHARPRFGMGSGSMMMGPGGDGPAMMLPLLLRSANLTDEQEAQVQKIMADRRAQTRALVLGTSAGFRLPEPTRRANLLVNALRRGEPTPPPAPPGPASARAAPASGP